MVSRAIREPVLGLVWLVVLAGLIVGLNFSFSLVAFGVLFAVVLILFGTNLRRFLR